MTPRKTRLRWFALAVGLVAVGLIAWNLDAMLWRASGGLIGMGTDRPTRAEVESIGRIHLPPESTNLRARLIGFQDRVIWVRFRLPAGKVAAFLDALEPPQSLSAVDEIPAPLNLPPDDLGWWNPQDARRPEAGVIDWPGVRRGILIDRDDDGRGATVYVQTAEF